MAVGVSIAQIHVAIIVIDMLAEGVGYVVHGIGCIPVIDLIMKLKDEQNVTTSESDETRERGRATGVDSTARNRSRAREDALSED